MKGKPNKKQNKPKISIYWVYGIIFLIFLLIQVYTSMVKVSKIDKNKFFELVSKNEVEKVVIINKEIAEVYLKKEAFEKPEHKSLRDKGGWSPNMGPQYEFNIGDLRYFQEKLDEYEKKNEIKLKIEFETRKNIWGSVFNWIFPIFLFLIIWFFLFRKIASGGGGGSIFNIGKSKANLFDKDTKMKITFKDVAGCEGAKEEVKEIVSFLKEPKRYTSLGGKIPKGVLLIGPPGTGKTLLAKAVAGEAQVPFFSLSGSDFVEMFVGVGASRVRDLFRQAKEKSPSIIFIDEIDAIGRARGRASFTGANDERENTLNQLLTEMDGFGTDTNVIILGATNRADVLDKALLRAGRFDRHISVDLPDLKEREEIFKVHISKLIIKKDVDVKFLSKQTPGFSGADIANICNEAALIAGRKGNKKVCKQSFLSAIDRIVGGLEKRNKIISENEKKIIAFHEAGHAIVSWLLEGTSSLVKVTIVPRGQSLGAAWYLPEERQITTQEQILDEICVALGGRASEEIIFNKISTGALSDLHKVTKQAQSMVMVYGFNKKVGNVTYYDPMAESKYSFTKPYSEQTAKMIDEEIQKIVDTQYKRAIKILSENKKYLDKLANILLEKEIIFREDLELIFKDKKKPAKKTIKKTKAKKDEK